jgi:hypothetical protein
MQILWIMWARLAHVRAARRSRIGLAVLVPVVALAGCDPCAGLSCSTTPHVTITGTIVNPTTGAGAPGVSIALRVTDAGGHSAETTTTTDASGVWQATVDLQTSGNANAVVTVSTTTASYTATLPVKTSTKRGDAIAVGLWTDVPYIQQLLSVVVKDQPLVDAVVHFEQKSGPHVLVAQTDSRTNGAGIFELRFVAQTLGSVVGVLTITHPSLASPIVLPDLAIGLDYHFKIAAPNGTIFR